MSSRRQTPSRLQCSDQTLAQCRATEPAESSGFQRSVCPKFSGGAGRYRRFRDPLKFRYCIYTFNENSSRRRLDTAKSAGIAVQSILAEKRDLPYTRAMFITHPRPKKSILPPLSRKRKTAHTVEAIDFDNDARQEYLTGFHKRKLQRIKRAQEESAKREKEEKLEARKQVRV